MNRFLKMTILAAAGFSAIATPITSASADSWGRHSGRWHPSHHRHNRTGDAIAAGILGLAAGAVVGSIMSQPQPVYAQPVPTYSPPPPVYYPAPPAYAPTYRGYEPWSRGWYNYCSERYRSFNPNTGTYRGYDGQDHFCTAN